MSSKKKYDLICSLGGNCAASNNLIQRKLRLCSLPFDWLCMKDDSVLFGLAESFKNNFSNFMLKENMKYISHEEFGPNGHSNRVFYQDTATGYYYLNHFNKKLDDDFEYEKVKKTMDRRIERFQNLVKKSKNILFILSSYFEMDEEKIIYFAKTLKNLYPDKDIEIKSIQFNSNKKITRIEELQANNIEILRYERATNVYDFKRTNFEWHFLDNIELNLNLYKKEEVDLRNEKIKKDYKIIDFTKIKKGVRISILPALNTVIYIKLYLFGVRFQLSLGVIRNE